MLYNILFCTTASREEYEAHLEAVRADMIAWKSRTRPLHTGIDLTKLEISI